jgi:hypothetical protein
MQGVVFDSDEPFNDLSEIVLTKNKFSCRYLDYHVEATSRDGVVYRGNWNHPDYDAADCPVELTRFESKTKEVVLLGPWQNKAENYAGVYLFRLNQ